MITKSHNGLVFVGNDFTLTAEISFNDPTLVDEDTLLNISWSRENDVLTSNDRISVSSVSVSDSGYTASLMYSPIAASDSGLITATVTVSPSDDSTYVQSVTATATETLIVQGMLCLSTSFKTNVYICPYNLSLYTMQN